jgi:hypothetical protein
MAIPAAEDPSFGFAPGDHVCAFYNRGRSMVDDPASVRSRVPAQLVARDGMLNVLSDDDAYLPEDNFSKETFIRGMENRLAAASHSGYGSLRGVGGESFIVRHGVHQTNGLPPRPS